jgi:hypothetical protein
MIHGSYTDNPITIETLPGKMQIRDLWETNNGIGILTESRHFKYFHKICLKRLKKSEDKFKKVKGLDNIYHSQKILFHLGTF